MISVDGLIDFEAESDGNGVDSKDETRKVRKSSSGIFSTISHMLSPISRSTTSSTLPSIFSPTNSTITMSDSVQRHFHTMQSWMKVPVSAEDPTCRLLVSQILEVIAQHGESVGNLGSLTGMKQFLEISYPDDKLLNPSWTLCGFQNEEPFSDFRGSGILGLRCIHYLSIFHQLLFLRWIISSISVDPNNIISPHSQVNADKPSPLALTVINVVSSLSREIGFSGPIGGVLNQGPVWKMLSNGSSYGDRDEWSNCLPADWMMVWVDDEACQNLFALTIQARCSSFNATTDDVYDCPDNITMELVSMMSIYCEVLRSSRHLSLMQSSQEKIIDQAVERVLQIGTWFASNIMNQSSSSSSSSFSMFDWFVAWFWCGIKSIGWINSTSGSLLAPSSYHHKLALMKCSLKIVKFIDDISLSYVRRYRKSTSGCLATACYPYNYVFVPSYVQLPNFSLSVRLPDESLMKIFPSSSPSSALSLAYPSFPIFTCPQFNFDKSMSMVEFSLALMSGDALQLFRPSIGAAVLRCCIVDENTTNRFDFLLGVSVDSFILSSSSELSQSSSSIRSSRVSLTLPFLVQCFDRIPIEIEFVEKLERRGYRVICHSQAFGIKLQQEEGDEDNDRIIAASCRIGNHGCSSRICFRYVYHESSSSSSNSVLVFVSIISSSSSQLLADVMSQNIAKALIR